jgi:hypothetical protein
MNGFVVELVEYLQPAVRRRPAGYLISDQGILNIALGCTEKALFDRVYERAVASGFHGITEPWTVPDVATVVYLNGPFGCSVELLHVPTTAFERMGFVPA